MPAPVIDCVITGMVVLTLVGLIGVGVWLWRSRKYQTQTKKHDMELQGPDINSIDDAPSSDEATIPIEPPPTCMINTGGNVQSSVSHESHEHHGSRDSCTRPRPAFPWINNLHDSAARVIFPLTEEDHPPNVSDPSTQADHVTDLQGHGLAIVRDSLMDTTTRDDFPAESRERSPYAPNESEGSIHQRQSSTSSLSSYATHSSSGRERDRKPRITLYDRPINLNVLGDPPAARPKHIDEIYRDWCSHVPVAEAIQGGASKGVGERMVWR